jgi:molybdopterin molybdotransferase
VEQVPARLEVLGELKAGDWPEPEECSVGRGQAVGIMTGAPLPAGADAVVMVEYTVAAGTAVEVEIQRSVKPGENFVPRGAEARAGQLLLDRGRRLDHAGIAIAASVGKSRVQVFRKPRVAVLSTGDEVVEIDATPGPAEIRNSNSYSLAAQVQNAGGEPVRLRIAPDERKRLRDLIEEGLRCDLLLLTGGVSMGKYDLVEQVLGELQAEFYFTGAEIQPGRPVVFGSCSADTLARDSGVAVVTRAGAPAPHKKYFFGLPGNPVSTMVTFELFARPMIEALAGITPQRLIFLRARLKSEIRTKTGLKRFLPAVLSGEFENAEVELAKWQGSGDVATLARANCYVVIPPDRERIETGEWVSLLMR